MTFKGYSSDGAILQSKNLKTVYNGIKEWMRDSDPGAPTAAIICGLDGKPLFCMLRKYGIFHIFRKDDSKNLFAMLRCEFMADDFGKYCFSMAMSGAEH